ncbi:unnamed protein product [Pedinophyceae sp. YPF-701]|nr:unnamed protein product [Pedinophyceae sp. YPF-701]
MATSQSLEGDPIDASGFDRKLSELVRNKSLLHRGGYIGGEFITDAPHNYHVKDPANFAPLARVSLMGGAETESAIAAAAAALQPWAQTPAAQRAAVLRRWHDLILENREDIATIMTLECGKPLKEARLEIDAGAASVLWFAGEAQRICGDVMEPPARDRRLMVFKQPVGVVAAITPWNFPMSMVTRKVAPALAAGCSVVLKPAEETPLTALALAGLAADAGLPPGVMNVVFGDRERIGDVMLESHVVRKLAFTGSTAVGKMLNERAARSLKRVSLELGGNAPLIVFPDADLDLAVTGAIGSAFRNAGQTCICANRVFVHEDVYDQFADLIAARVRTFVLGSGLDPEVTMGPLITSLALDKVDGHVQDALAQGATAMVGGHVAEMPPEFQGGTYYAPTVLRDATIDMRCFREETFGPIAPLFKFRSEDEVVAMANDTEYGLASYFYTADLARAFHVAERLDFGMVGVNEVGIVSEVAPFGGMKQSGLGREQSKYGIQEFLDIKYVCMGLGAQR